MASAIPFVYWGRRHYASALADMEAARAQMWDDKSLPGTVFVAEHPSVITLGRNADDSDILATPGRLMRAGIEVVRTRRGGQATYHGPGQLLVYPVVRVGRSVATFLECVAAGVVEVCEALGVHGAAWRCNPMGLWRGDRKVASCGIHVSRGVSIHGFALNVQVPRENWQNLRPCGLAPDALASLSDFPGYRDIEGKTIASRLGAAVARRLNQRRANESLNGDHLRGIRQTIKAS